MIRKATSKDTKRIMELFREEYAKPPYHENWTEKRAKQRIKDYSKSHKTFVLEINRKIQQVKIFTFNTSQRHRDYMRGFIIITFSMWHTGLRGYGDEIVVSFQYQGKGHGKELVEFAENYFKQKGAREASLRSSKKSRAFKIYRKLNYKEEKGFVSMYKQLK